MPKNLGLSAPSPALPPFHLAIAVHDLAAAIAFYGELLGCAMGRRADTWIDFNLFGHQLVCHLTPPPSLQPRPTKAVDGDQVPIPHFGVVLGMSDWQSLVDRLNQAQVEFIVAPRIRFSGLPGEQATFFLYDPSGNALEFKAFRDVPTQLFATE